MNNNIAFFISDQLRKDYIKELCKFTGERELTKEEKKSAETIVKIQFLKRCEWNHKVNSWYQEWKESKELTDPTPKVVLNCWKLDITPQDGIGVERFKQLILEIFKKDWWKSYFFVLEQRGDTNETIGKGVHCHAIIEFNDTRQGWKRYKTNILSLVRKKKLDEFIAQNQVNFNKIKCDLERDNRVKYMNPFHFGKGSEKKTKWEHDKLMRQRWDIKPYYEANSLLPLPSESDP